MSYSFNDITQWKILPLKSVKIHTGTSDPKSVGLVEFFNLKEGSTVKLSPILAENDTGGSNIVGWFIECDFIVVQDNLQTMLPTLRALTHVKPTDLDIEFEAPDEQINGEKLWLTADELLDTDDINIHFSVESSGPSPELHINVKEVLSVEAIDMATQTLFIQYW